VVRINFIYDRAIFSIYPAHVRQVTTYFTAHCAIINILPHTMQYSKEWNNTTCCVSIYYEYNEQ
jgi:hypothetical protein